MIRELVEGTSMVVRGPDAALVTTIVIDSKHVTAGSLFVAIKGIALDGHHYLVEAVARGASALVVEDATHVPAEFTGPVIVVPDGRAALNHLASRSFGDPGSSMFCAGITGTDGKTTIAWMAEAVLDACGLATGVIGTVDHHFADHRWPGDTTPPPLVLQERLSQFRALGARAVVFEATSQGLSQSRVGSVPLDVAVFSNLTRDHLDYHGTVDAYFEAKQRLFTEVLAASPKAACHAIVNIDTPWGARLRVPTHATRWTYGRAGAGADLEYDVLSSGFAGTVVRLSAWGRVDELHLPMLGDFNGANALAAIAIGLAAGCDLGSCVDGLRRFAGVPGRVQRVDHPGDKLVLVDYAHDPDAFEKLLATVGAAMRRERPGGRLVTLFGCGGDRDRGKRPLMLEVALRSSDRVIITSDNPRSEDPRAIVQDILAGASPTDQERVTVEPDRAAAIGLALRSTAERDVVLLLGKGHEPYQIVGDRKLPFSDIAVAAAALRG